MIEGVAVIPFIFGGIIGGIMGSAMVTIAWCFDELESSADRAPSQEQKRLYINSLGRLGHEGYGMQTYGINVGNVGRLKLFGGMLYEIR